jgi:small subunit ribosomal protein S8e
MTTNKGKKITGGKYIKQRKKKRSELAGQKRVIKMSPDEKRKTARVRGGNKRTYLLKAKFVNVLDKKSGKTQKLEITKVIETPSNTFLARQNIITKGTIIETSKGKVRVTNRPTQEGSVNGVLLEQ